MILAKVSRSRALGWSARGLLPLALPATVIVITLMERRRRRRPVVTAAPAEDAGVSVPEQGALDFESGPLASASDPAAGSALPLPLVVADQRFSVGLTRLIRATLQPEAAFIEAHYSNMGYWATVIEPWALDADKRPVRRISYTTPLKKNSLGPSTADCIETWCLRSWTAGAFVVSIEARTPNVPYGGSFHQELLFVGTAEGALASRLCISAQVVFDKRVFGVGGLIKGSSEAGMKETYAAYVQVLQEYFLHPQALKVAAVPAATSPVIDASAAPRLVQSDVVLRTSLLVLVVAVLWILLWQRWLLSRSVAFQAAFQQAC